MAWESEAVFPALPLTSFVIFFGSPQQFHFLLSFLQCLKSLQVRSNSNWGLPSLQCNVIVTCCNANNKEMLYFLVMLTLFILHHIILAFFPPIQLRQDVKEPNHLLGNLWTYTTGKLHVKKTFQSTSEMITALQNSSLISLTFLLHQLPVPGIWRGPILYTSLS